MADVKWIKIVTDVFDNRKVRQIENMPEGDSILVIWFKLLCLAGNINDKGMVYLTAEVPFTEEMLATEFRKPINTIRLALELFQRFKMVEIIDNILKISSWEKYQNVAGMEKIRAQTQKRVSAYRNRKHKSEIEESNSCNATGNVTVTHGNATDIDIDKKRIDKEIDIKDIVETSISTKPTTTKFPSESFEMLCVETLIHSCLEQYPNSKVPAEASQKEKWAAEIEKMRRIDHRSEVDIRQALQFAIEDSFWKTNIRSTKKFREKFETLYTQSRNRRKPADSSFTDMLQNVGKKYQ